MVETFGANRGITPPMRKGIKGSDVRYNVNDGLDGDYGSPKDAQWRFEAKARARVMDLQHYLGEEWIDYKVLRCTECRNAYETNSMQSGGRNTGNRILPSTVFDNVPLHKGECGLCG